VASIVDTNSKNFFFVQEFLRLRGRLKENEQKRQKRQKVKECQKEWNVKADEKRKE
jgi:hypothetical protein